MSTLRVNNITDTSGGSTNLTVPNTAKAWVNFNGTSTVAIRASFNVSSITDNGVGELKKKEISINLPLSHQETPIQQHLNSLFHITH